MWTTIGYIVAQSTGAVVGSLPLLLWAEMGKSIAFGATLPGRGFGFSTVLLGEVVTTFAMVALLAVFLGFRRLRLFTPAIFPPLYAVMVWGEGGYRAPDESSPQLRPCDYIGTMGWLVDLLAGAAGRNITSCPRL